MLSPGSLIKYTSKFQRFKLGCGLQLKLLSAAELAGKFGTGVFVWGLTSGAN